MWPLWGGGIRGSAIAYLHAYVRERDSGKGGHMVDAMRWAARHGALIGVAGALVMLPPGVVSAQASGGAVWQLAQAGPGSRSAAAAAQPGASDTDRQAAEVKTLL